MRLTTHYPNKINLGCGYDYLQDYLNVDFYNNVVADMKMSATTLNLPHSYFAEILLKDVIEHFGYCDSLAVLAKGYLLLKPDGLLVITTPDIEKAFRQYNSALNLADKENILCHIYGIEDAGMTHKFCFSLPILENLLNKSGFKIVVQQKFADFVFRPSVRVVAQKIDDHYFEKRSTVLSAMAKNKKLRITYADFPYYEAILEEVLRTKDIKKTIYAYEHISPKLLLFLLNNKEINIDKKLVWNDIKRLKKLLKEPVWRFTDFWTKEAQHKYAQYTAALSLKNNR
ncbi:MAG: class I SAM-dependent methyltransferase [Candidatus Margulisbacteria bacterium]|jgi:predicted SAM-dependent methyltransferase|nr:class I SAM-dependent methyltransferase [Candidatus Margulisiibacteriota bacterium]